MNPRLENVNRIILSIGHGGLDGEIYDPGAINSATNEKENIIAGIIAQKTETALNQKGINVVVIPDYGLKKSIRYVNDKYNQESDWAIEIHKDSTGNYNSTSMAKRIGIYYHLDSEGSKDIADEMVKYMKESGAGQTSWSRPDTQSNHGKLGWIRDTKMLSYIIEAGFMQDDNSGTANDFYAELIAGAICEVMVKESVIKPLSGN